MYTLDKRFKIDDQGYPILTEEQQAIEYIKCKLSLSYFVSNYVFLNVSGKLQVGNSEAWKKTYRYHELLNTLQYVEFNVLLGSRQIFKTTSLYYMAAWLLLFYPNYTILFVTLDQARILEFVRNTNFILKNVAPWMRIENKSKSEKALTIELKNESRLLTASVAGSVDIASIGRGLSAATIMSDEPAFYKKFEVLWTSIFPTYTKAADNAKRRGLPTNFIFATTPNGKFNEWYELIYKNAMSWDTLKLEMLRNEIGLKNDIEDVNKLREIKVADLKKLDPEYFFKNEHNGFLVNTLHWSLLYDQKWYEKQCAIFNYDRRKIGQELDLVFLGGSNSILDDEILAKLHIKEPMEEIRLYGGYKLLQYKSFENRNLIIGVDSAVSTLDSADFSAITIIDGVTKEELGTFKARIGILKEYANVIKSLVLYLVNELGINKNNVFLAIESNNIGEAVIQELIYDEFEDYEQYIIKSKASKNEDKYGITTNAKSRNDMQIMFLNTMNATPEVVSSRNLINDINALEQLRSGRIQAISGKHDDVWMSFLLALYGRQILIDKGLLIVEGEITKSGLNPTKKRNYLDFTMATLPDRQIETSDLETIIVEEKNERTELRVEDIIIF
jgi:hypothetical protein